MLRQYIYESSPLLPTAVCISKEMIMWSHKKSLKATTHKQGQGSMSQNFFRSTIYVVALAGSFAHDKLLHPSLPDWKENSFLALISNVRLGWSCFTLGQVLYDWPVAHVSWEEDKKGSDLTFAYSLYLHNEEKPNTLEDSLALAGTVKLFTRVIIQLTPLWRPC